MTTYKRTPPVCHFLLHRFQSKFQQIVQDEQDGNFITRLHGGKLNIIPWPVIASPQFYTLFPVLARRLEQQKPTHPSAGAFLYTLKTLMAKLKVCGFLLVTDVVLTSFRQMIGVLSLVNLCRSKLNGADVLNRDTHRSPSAKSFGPTAECVDLWFVRN